MRKVVAAVCFGIAGAALVVGAQTLSRLGDRHADSPDSTYLGVAAIMFGIAVVGAIVGALSLRER